MRRPYRGTGRVCSLWEAWTDLVRVNTWVNRVIKPLTDIEHWGVLERWSYPDDGYGDCEDDVLLKRRMLMQSGLPWEALLITVVRDEKTEGHAVLMVRNDKGDYILDNQNKNILLWSKTRYRFVKRQSKPTPTCWSRQAISGQQSPPLHLTEHTGSFQLYCHFGRGATELFE